MIDQFQLKTVTPSEFDGLIQFAHLSPWKPKRPEDLMRRFLTELSSSPELILDLHQNGKRVAVAVLVDKVLNKGNYASLEVLGIKSTADYIAVHEILIDSAKKLVPESRAGIELSTHIFKPFPAELINNFNLSFYYETFEMVRSDLKTSEIAASGPFEKAATGDDHELYEVLIRALSENVDISIPEFEDWKRSRSTAENLQTFVARKNKRIVGFVTLITPSSGRSEIRTVGVLPEARSKGIGRDLILHALKEAASLGYDSCKLSVAIHNRKALDLYRNLFFREVEHYQAYRWVRVSVNQ